MSPKGFEGIRSASKDIQRRRSSGGTTSAWFGLKDGETATVRFLEEGDEVAWCWQHELPYSSSGRSWGDKVVCRDTKDTGEQCPGCEQGMKRSFRGFVSLIHRDSDVFEKDDDGNIDWDTPSGKADQVKIWEGGITLFEELDGKDASYHGLKSRDFKITRRGTKLATKYIIEPADVDGGPQEMSEADKKLAADKPDLAEKTTPPSYEDWKKLLRGPASSDDMPGDGEVDFGEVNVFMQKRENA